MKKNLLRLTRSSYRRKLIMFGVSIFTSLALTATGFAAWVLSQDAQGSLDGNVQIGAVQEANIEIEDLDFVNDKNSFIFEPLESDVSGRVRNDGENFESLTVSIAWSLTNYQSVGDIYVDLLIPTSVKVAIDANYITLPAGLEFVTEGEQNALVTRVKTIGEGDSAKQVTYYVARYEIAPDLSGSGSLAIDGTETPFGTYEITADENDETVKTAAFTADLTFGWGSAFGYENPGIYFDGTGAGVEYDDVKEALLQLKFALHGMTYTHDTHFAMSEANLNLLYAENPIPGYFIEVTAKVS